jgi:uncharacterized protein YcfJ
MKKLTIPLSLIALTFLSSVASAERYDNDVIYAPVTDVQPIYKTYRVPQNHRVCENGNRNDRREQGVRKGNPGGAIIGGIIGGLIGNQFGRGHGREATTAAGVIAGASIGSKARPAGYYSNGPRCYTKRDYYEEQRIQGYDVAYDYNGRIYHTTMHNHPGDRVKIRVDVQVVEY